MNSTWMRKDGERIGKPFFQKVSGLILPAAASAGGLPFAAALALFSACRAIIIYALSFLSILAAVPAYGANPPGPDGELYVPEAHHNKISVIDTKTSKIIRSIPINDIPVLPLGSRPTVLVATSDGNKIYSDNFGLIPPTITAVDRKTGSVKSIQLSSVPLGASISEDGKEIYLPQGTYSVEVVATDSDKVVRRLSFSDVPVAAIKGPDGHLYVGFANGAIGSFDVRTGKALRQPIETGGTLPAWFTFTRDGKKLYVDAVNAIGVIDLRSWTLVKRIPTGDDASQRSTDPWPFTSTLAPDGKKLYVTLLGESGVLVIDVATDRVVAKIKTAGSTTGVAFSADGSRGYITDMGPSLSFLKTPAGGALLGNVWIGFGLLGSGQVVVFDPKTDEPVGEPIPTTPGPGIPVWVPPRG
ncbi:YncE family protein [Burkholderia pseudomallei]|uniref:YncE family protein n=1 Tax=Burkholderia pseudomallei TaxID=28450 RepID=UPI000A9645EB|nr:YncE family protein [Burkholderia pseudomallei]MEB5485318.1 YncE family protein [Burkholderia pseudomallei]MEB5491293.1 YncE family protein [Burkholderia pseudomallei]MEB5497596.1 YncE family protein [Burkholderia pseudomallei]MEB5504293.1 YncE family protein [Burkholderia pseudomallei]